MKLLMTINNLISTMNQLNEFSFTKFLDSYLNWKKHIKIHLYIV